MNSKTPRTDAALGGLLYSHPYLEKAVGEVALIEIELNEARAQVAFLEQLVHTSDEALAGLEETQTICEAQQEYLESLSTFTIPVSDVKPLLDTLRFINDECEWERREYDGGDTRIGPACTNAVREFLSKHPELK